MTEDEAFTQALATYQEMNAGEPRGETRQPDRMKSIITVDPAGPTVILRDASGVPLGTVVWYGESNATFEPPTKLTVVDHFHSLRSSQLQPPSPNPILVIDRDEFEYEHDGEAMRVWRRVLDKRADYVGTIQIFSGDAFTGATSLGPFAQYLRYGEVGTLASTRVETRDGGDSWIVGTCSKCGHAGEVHASVGARTHKALLCGGGHWLTVDVTPE